MQRIDIVTDLETLGIEGDSTIIQIAAIAFDINTGKQISSFNACADITKNEKLNVSASTLKWWLETDKDLLLEILSKGVSSSDNILKALFDWILSLVEYLYADTIKNVYFWGNGILFDNAMIKAQMKKLGLEYPIFYKNDRDMRTLVDLTCTKLGISEKELKESFKDTSLHAHDAFDDCKFEIAVITGCWNVMLGVITDIQN